MNCAFSLCLYFICIIAITSDDFLFFRFNDIILC